MSIHLQKTKILMLLIVDYFEKHSFIVCQIQSFLPYRQMLHINYPAL
jgi:hypothetical protein